MKVYKPTTYDNSIATICCEIAVNIADEMMVGQRASGRQSTMTTPSEIAHISKDIISYVGDRPKALAAFTLGLQTVDGTKIDLLGEEAAKAYVHSAIEAAKVLEPILSANSQADYAKPESSIAQGDPIETADHQEATRERLIEIGKERRFLTPEAWADLIIAAKDRRETTFPEDYVLRAMAYQTALLMNPRARFNSLQFEAERVYEQMLVFAYTKPGPDEFDIKRLERF